MYYKRNSDDLKVQTSLRCTMARTVRTILITLCVATLTHAQCPVSVLQAERQYYQSVQNSNYVIMQGIQHGIQRMGKCHFFANMGLLNLAPKCDGRCKYHEEGKPHVMKRQVTDCPAHTNQGQCDPNRYRSIDGHCNNLQHVTWGRSNTMQRRILPPKYGDGPEDGEELECKVRDRNNPECFPIDVPPNDPSFTVEKLNFARSEFREDCDGVRQQLNFQSSYIDASAVYGANTQESRLLREYSDGKLKMNLRLLPVDFEDASCILSGPINEENNYCGRAGDIRVNEQPGLAALHTLFVREHNRIAGNLSAMFPMLADEVIYQEARKIVAAEIQLVTYKEFLPAVLGPVAMNTYGFTISDGFNTDTYSDSVDASIQNAFAAAILRFGHTLVPQDIGMVRRNYTNVDIRQLSDTFFNPETYHSNGNKGPDDILRWISVRKSAKADKRIENSVRNDLFKDSEGGRIDLAALNIQRGRDHGLPSYIEWRKHCGLSTATSFETLADHTVECMEKLKSVYKCVDDIDLFTGALTENRRSNSLLGPVQQCILGEQFQALKNGDRFYFEREDSEVGFTEAQLRNIQSLNLASIFCANTDSNGIQQNMFMLPPKTEDGMFYQILPCESLPQLDFSLWSEITN